MKAKHHPPDPLVEDALNGKRPIHTLSQEELVIVVHALIRVVHDMGRFNDTMFRMARAQHRTIQGMSVCVGVVVFLTIGQALLRAYYG